MLVALPKCCMVSNGVLNLDRSASHALIHWKELETQANIRLGEGDPIRICRVVQSNGFVKCRVLEICFISAKLTMLSRLNFGAENLNIAFGSLD